MRDVTTAEPVKVRNEADAGPYVRVPVMQIDEIRKLLDERGVFYWVSEHAISLNNAPAIITVEFGRNADQTAIQAIFDSVK